MLTPGAPPSFCDATKPNVDMTSNTTPRYQSTSVAVGARDDHPGEADPQEGARHRIAEGSGVVVEHIGINRCREVGEGGLKNRTSCRPKHDSVNEGMT